VARSSSHTLAIAATPGTQPGPRLRLAEAIAALSLATDLGMGQPMEKGLRTALLATGLGRRLRLDQADLSDLYYLGLLIHVGCSATAFEYEMFTGGDDLEMRRRLVAVNSQPVAEIGLTVFAGLAEIAPPEKRDGLLAAMMQNPNAGAALLTGQCEAAMLLVRQLGLPGSLVAAIGQMYERWDGMGVPNHVSGEDIEIRIRVLQVAHDAEVLHRETGSAAASSELRRRAEQGGLDPGCVAAFVEASADLFSEIPEEDLWQAALASEPSPVKTVGDAALDGICEGFGQFADLKSPFTLGHSSAVAQLAHDAALADGSDEREAISIRRAGHLHDVGRIGVPNGIWDKPGRLSEAEFERVRLHPYYTERILHRPGLLAPLAGLAAGHHERVDGSGYHRGLDAARQSRASRVLAAADTYQAMTQPRPHRPALAGRAAAAELRAEARAGRLDSKAVGAVLEALGHSRRSVRGTWPAVLSDREVDVLRLLCTGRTNKDMAQELHISPKTVGRHIENIYVKTGVSTRASVTVFALQQGIVAG